MIKIIKDESFTFDSTDNDHSYAWMYTDDSKYKTTNIGIFLENEAGEIYNSAILAFDGFSSVSDTTHLEIERKLYLLVGKYMVCLKLDDLSLIWKVECDPSTTFQIFQIKDSFLVHGEQEISRIDYFGNILWSFSGKDIFVCKDEDNIIEIENDEIRIKDWEGNMYRLDYNGKIKK